MRRAVMARLVCVTCRGELRWTEAEVDGDDVLSALARCADCGARYEVREGVAIMAAPNAEDIWRDSARGLADALAAEPETERALMDAPLNALNGADLAFRGMVHEARGELAAAAAAFAAADRQLYGAEQRACRDELLAACAERTIGAEWVLDVASGRGALVEGLARAGVPTVASDLSAVAMLRLRGRLAAAGFAGTVDCLVADAAALPFADGSVPAATTYVGLQNIPDARPVLHELRRACDGSMRTVGYGYPPEDTTNRRALEELGFTGSADLDAVRATAAAADWRMTT
ncbi:MAG TPA: methyltransferase domain-containing protein, partial [Candidatus Limnocylindria bacterium]|nr:methyltransferase domain-containing protein [Candidatus Limnocylindria bacterium]